MFSQDLTIINKYFNKATKQTTYKASHIHGFWMYNDAVSINGTQLVKSDSASVRILMSEPDYNPKFQENRRGWILQNDDYIVKGKVNFTTIANLLENHADVIKITSIATKDYGSKDMWHWNVSGK